MSGTKAALNAFIAEDEPPARERLVGALGRVAPEVVVVGQADSVKGTQAWLASHAAPDLLLLDIQLADGLSLELFKDGALALPTIFTTAYDRFAIDAFQALAIDYLLKPVNEDALAQALGKVQRLRRSFGADVVASLMLQLQPHPGLHLGPQLGPRLGPHSGSLLAPPWRQRLVGRKGAQFHALPVERVAYVVSLDKLAFAVDEAGERYLLDTPLAELEAELDPSQFFRANRQLLVAARAVVRFGPVGKGRLKVELQPAMTGDVVVSQERAAAFKAWLGG
ncbi:MAG: response regulator transcription factor [Rubrivivax sp.]|nr:response regulator transcription factor [Rubrivivax sp.]